VIIDLDRPRSSAQQELVKKYYRGSIPHLVVLDSSGKPVYNDAGEVAESTISKILDGLLK
jgi:thioredoxin-related protein